MLVVAKTEPTDEDVKRWLGTIPGFLAGLTEVDGKPTAPFKYQKAFLNNRSKFRAVEKARGTGFSWVCAAEALAKAHLRRDYTGIFVSVNLDEALEKIRYANLLYESLPLSWRKRKVIDNRTAVEFEGDDGGRSRLLSHPCKEPRGKHNADVYLDEFAHYGKKAHGIYVAAVPVVSRGNGQMTVGSTALGVGGEFYEVMKEEHREFPGFTRQSVPWWECPDFCNDEDAARADAPKMTTEERVAAYGTQPLLDVYGAMELEDFQQEYEIRYNDEASSYFPYGVILPCCNDTLVLHGTLESIIQGTTGPLYAGYDVGRTRNVSEFVALEQVGKRWVMRMLRTFDRSKFKAQEGFLRQVMKRSKRFRRLCIDRHGIGMQLAETMRSEFGSRVEPLALIGQVKEMLAVDMRICLEAGDVELPADRGLVQQIHSIKKSPTMAGYARFDTERNEKHHADKFWSLALAIHATGYGKEGRKTRRRRIKVTMV